MELDARTAPDGCILTTDVCIIGAGPIGLVLAAELGRGGTEVVLLDSAHRNPLPEVQDLNAADTREARAHDLRLSRARAIGGTAALWNTMVEGAAFAKYVPLDPIDFESREGLPDSGWPWPRTVLEPWFPRAHAACGLGPFDYSAERWRGTRTMLELPSEGLCNAVYHFGPRSRFTEDLPDLLEQDPRITLVRGATAVRMERSSSGQITELHWATLSGKAGIVRASRFVLAVGGIENARFLLSVGLSSPWLGRGFTEHPVDSSLMLVSRARSLAPAAGFYAATQVEPGRVVLGRLGLTPELLRAERLPNASIRLLHDDAPAVLQSPRLLPLARRIVPMQGVRRAIGGVIRTAARWRQPRAAQYRLLLDLEQAPHPENRVMLSTETDALGVPRARLVWSWRAEDEARLRRLRTVVIRELERAGAGRITQDPNRALDPFAHHHAGTTRIHSDPEQGVVDPDLRVHGMENLYVAGSSVFPSAGFANPTLTAIALALRLADSLGRRG